MLVKETLYLHAILDLLQLERKPSLVWKKKKNQRKREDIFAGKTFVDEPAMQV